MNKKLIKNIAILAVVYIGGVYVYKMLKKNKEVAATPKVAPTPTGSEDEASFSNVSGYRKGAYNKQLDAYYYYPEGNPQGRGFYRQVTAAERPRA